MTSQEERRTVEAVLAWAQGHPEPDLVVLQTAQGRRLTPRQISHEILEPTATRRLFLAMVDGARKRVEFEEILADFRRVGPNQELVR